MPGASTNTWLDPDRAHLIAHRGASLHAKANTPAAIAEAARRGATDVEIDVNMTADGVLLVTHDQTVDVSGTRRWISQTESSDVLAGAADRGDTVVPLGAALGVVADTNLGVYIDVKQLLPGGVPAVADALDHAGLRDRAVAASFRADLVAEFSHTTGLVTSLLFHDPGLDLHSVERSTGCSLVHPCYDVFPDPLEMIGAAWMEAVRAAGLGVITWNTLDVDVAEAVLRLGARGVCSDDPAVLVEARNRLLHNE